MPPDDVAVIRSIDPNLQIRTTGELCNERIIFASNMEDPRGRDFDLFLIREDGTGLERVTFNDSFDSFPMFSPNGRHLVFASNRFGSEEGETNVFIAEWVDDV